MNMDNRSIINNNIDDMIAFSFKCSRDYEEKINSGERQDMICTANVISHE